MDISYQAIIELGYYSSLFCVVRIQIITTITVDCSIKSYNSVRKTFCILYTFTFNINSRIRNRFSIIF